MYGKRNCRNVLLRKLTNPVFLPVNFTSFEEHCNVSSRVDFALFCSVQLNQCHYLHDLVHLSIAHTTSFHMNCNPSHLTLAYLKLTPLPRELLLCRCYTNVAYIDAIIFTFCMLLGTCRKSNTLTYLLLI